MRGLISVDDHLFEPVGLFDAPGAPAGVPVWGEREIDGKTFPGWTFGQKFYPISQAAVEAGHPWGHRGIFVPATVVPDHLSDPTARLKAMDEDGIAVSLCFPSFLGLGGETLAKHYGEVPDRTLWFCMERFNSWILREWCAAAPGRFIPVGILPLWDPKSCADEVNIMAECGFKGVFFPQAPDQIGLPPVWHPAWQPLYRALENRGMVLCQHILSDGTERYTNSKLPPYLPLTLARTSAIETIASWILTPILDSHPRLRIMVAEAGVGWIPWFLEVADQSARLHSAEFGAMKMLPSERMEQHFGITILNESVAYGTILSLPTGLQNRLMFESDYPHLDGTYPLSKAHFAGLDIPTWMRFRVGRLNAVEFFRLENAYDFPAGEK